MLITLFWWLLYWLLYYVLRLNATNLHQILLRPRLAIAGACLENKYIYAIWVVIGVIFAKPHYKQAFLNFLKAKYFLTIVLVRSFAVGLYCHWLTKMNSFDHLPIFPSTIGKTWPPKFLVNRQFMFSNVMELYSPIYLYVTNIVRLLLQKPIYFMSKRKDLAIDGPH